jgi:hypothetical protein
LAYLQQGSFLFWILASFVFPTKGNELWSDRLKAFKELALTVELMMAMSF